MEKGEGYTFEIWPLELKKRKEEVEKKR